MNYFRTAALVLVASSLLWAKGDMVLIEVKGADLTASIQITDPRIQEFNIWAGVGVNDAKMENAEGFIIDWKAGFALAPSGFRHYRVEFYAGCRRLPDDPSCAAERPRLAYVVAYDYDPSSNQGFVYLPRFFEPWSELNCGSICRGVEGRWFLATKAWVNFVTPILEKGRAVESTR